MASDFNSFTKDPVQGLVDYVIDVKPFHTKIVDVLVEYIYTDAISVKITDSIEFVIDIDLDRNNAFVDGGFDTYPWGNLLDGVDPFKVEGDPYSEYKRYNDGYESGILDGTDPITTPWDLIPANTQAGQTMVLAVFQEELNFSHGSTIHLSDALNAYLCDEDNHHEWDSGLRAHNIVRFDHLNDRIAIPGNHSAERNGVVLDGQSGRPYSIGFTGHTIMLNATRNNDGVHTVVDSEYDSVEGMTYLTVVPPLNKPMELPLNSIFGRLSDVDSIYFDPRIGYEGPFPYDSNKAPMGREGWGSCGWSKEGKRYGARRTNSVSFIADADGDIFRTTEDLPYAHNDVVYIGSDGSLPCIEFYGKKVDMMRYTPYYYIPGATPQEFKLAMEHGGPAMPVLTEGSATHYIGVGEHITFLEIAIEYEDDSIATTVDEGITVSQEVLTVPQFNNILRVETGAFIISGDITAVLRIGSEMTVTNSFNGLNDGDWVISDLSYDELMDETTINVAGPSPTDVYPYGAVVLADNRHGAMTAQAAITDTISFHVNNIHFTDTISTYIDESVLQHTMNETYGVPSIMNSFDVTMFGIGGFGGDFI